MVSSKCRFLLLKSFGYFETIFKCYMRQILTDSDLSLNKFLQLRITLEVFMCRLLSVFLFKAVVSKHHNHLWERSSYPEGTQVQYINLWGARIRYFQLYAYKLYLGRTWEIACMVRAMNFKLISICRLDSH